jgi:esterase/lipase
MTKKIIKALIHGSLLLLVIFTLGPSVNLDIHPKTLSLPADLDSYLKESEAAFSDIIPNTEKHIQWAHEDRQATELAFVYLHGFSASRQEISPVTENLAKDLGANLFQTRLTGHGRGYQPMGETSVDLWANDALEAIQIGRAIGRQVIVIGTSTGGTLATWLALQTDANKPDALILISPNFAPNAPGSQMLTWPWGKQIAELVLGKERHFEARHPLQKIYWSTGYPTVSLLPMMGLVNLVNESELETIDIPVLTIYSPNDGVVSPAKTEAALARFGSKINEVMQVTNSTDKNEHVIAGDILSPITNKAISKRIKTFLAHLEKKNLQAHTQ